LIFQFSYAFSCFASAKITNDFDLLS
jgi:hypothetical protein